MSLVHKVVTVQVCCKFHKAAIFRIFRIFQMANVPPAFDEENHHENVAKSLKSMPMYEQSCWLFPLPLFFDLHELFTSIVHGPAGRMSDIYC